MQTCKHNNQPWPNSMLTFCRLQNSRQKAIQLKCILSDACLRPLTLGIDREHVRLGKQIKNISNFKLNWKYPRTHDWNNSTKFFFKFLSDIFKSNRHSILLKKLKKRSKMATAAIIQKYLRARFGSREDIRPFLPNLNHIKVTVNYIRRVSIKCPFSLFTLFVGVEKRKICSIPADWA